MKRILYWCILYALITSLSYAQDDTSKVNPIGTKKASSEVMVKYLDDLNGQVNNEKFSEIAFYDFTKFVIGDENQFGRALNYASFQVDKPNATLNLFIRAKKFGFINFLASGGFDSDLFSVVSNEKPATKFSTSLSYSYLFKKNYYYYPDDKHLLWAVLVDKFDDSVNIKELDSLIKAKQNEVDACAESIKNNFYFYTEGRPKRKKLDVTKHKELIDKLDHLNSLNDSLVSLMKKRQARLDFTDSLAASAKWSTRRWLWLTAAANYGGISYKYYNINAIDKKLLADINGFTRSGNISINLLFKSIHPKWYIKIINNSLLTLGVEYGRQNNFNSFTPYEYKTEQTIDSATTNTKHIKSKTREVYTDVLKEYDALRFYFEFIKLFGDDGNIGIRNRFIFENPESSSQLKSNVNWELGLLFNTTSKKDKEITKFSIEAFVKFIDLSGRNVIEVDKPQKFYSRHTIGIRTNLPFKFSSLNDSVKKMD